MGEWDRQGWCSCKEVACLRVSLSGMLGARAHAVLSKGVVLMEHSIESTELGYRDCRSTT
eukprot:3176280-Rhodomonas_salina.2